MKNSRDFTLVAGAGLWMTFVNFGNFSANWKCKYVFSFNFFEFYFYFDVNEKCKCIFSKFPISKCKILLFLVQNITDTK